MSVQRTSPIDAADRGLARLISHVVPGLSAEAVYLFGSRARGTQREDSDYDLLVIVPDALPRERLAPQEVYSLARAAHVAADIVPCRRSTFERMKDQVGTLSYEAAHFGTLVHGQ